MHLVLEPVFKTTTQDKGHRNQFLKLIEQQKNGGHPIIPFDDIVNTAMLL